MKLIKDQKVLLAKIQILQYLLYAVFLVILCRLWQVQILQGSEYQQMAERNRIRTLDLPAPRGIIRDREGRSLVSNRPSFNIQVNLENLKDKDKAAGERKEETMLLFAERELSLDRQVVKERLDKFRNGPLYKPVTIKEDVTWADIGTVEAHLREHPELTISQEPRRLYPLGAVGAHVLGYVGEISEEQMALEEFPQSRRGDLVGKHGIERVYNSLLTGKDGYRQVVVNSLGRIARTLEKRDAVPGQDVLLTIDLDLQLVAEKLLEGRVGTLVAMDPNNGEILAMVSRPAFDPNSFISRISSKDWQELVNDPASPFMNRAIQATYSPGSIFKIIMAYTGLSEGVIRPSNWIFCNGEITMYDRVFHCSHRGGHGYVNVSTAIQSSCNIYFYLLGRQLGIDLISRKAKSLGLGEKTGIDLPGERSGLVPDTQWKKKRFGRPWYAGETVSVAIGQGALSATPLQILKSVSALAVGGQLVQPHFLLDDSRFSSSRQAGNLTPVSYTAENRAILRDSMWRVVNSGGTGYLAAVQGMDVCGKTGTVQVIGKEKRTELNIAEGTRDDLDDHAWFVGFAPKNSPEIAVVAFVEHGGTGGKSAAPLAAEVFREYFRKKGLLPPAVDASIADSRPAASSPQP